MEELSGYVDHIVYRNADNGYTVFELVTDEDEITVTGSFRSIDEGETIKVTGEEIRHPNYGKQFKVSAYEIIEPTDEVAIERYLASGTIKGIGPTMARRIVKSFGVDSFRIMEEEPERLSEIKGISSRIAENIGLQMREKRGMRRAMIYLQELGISSNLAVKIYSTYELGLFDILKENPYKMVEDIPGVGFKTADEIAARAGILPDSVFRLQSGIIYTVNQAMMEGHTYMPLEQVSESAAALLETTKVQIELQIDNLIVAGKLISKNEGGVERIYSALCYYTELKCARGLKDLDLTGFENDEKLRSTIEAIEQQEKIVLDEKQADAVILAASRGVSVITGGPGTGKTTIIKVLLEYFDRERLSVELAAPTGRAAKRMTEATGYEARTIHRMLEIGGGSQEFARNEDNPLESDVVIIDEMSMVDIFLFNSLIKAMVPGQRLILVGDVSQLPSVGPGSVLKDIIDSASFGVAVLDRIFRQAAKSDIVMNAHYINKGQQIRLDNDSEDFFFLERRDADQIIEGIIYLVTKKLPPYVKAQPFEIQVMTPMRKGVLGVENLNAVLQERLNPPSRDKEEIAVGGMKLREGDKVMQIKNNYQLEWEIRSKYGICIDKGVGIFNGDTGVVKEVNRNAATVTIVYDDNREVIYDTAGLDEVELAYAITIHKSQGSEYPAVVLPLLSGPSMLMSRNLLYTAVTRAKKCVMIIGSSDSVRSMIDNKNEMYRNCGLKERIIELEQDEISLEQNS